MFQCMVNVLGSMTAIAARSNSSPHSVHAFSLLILLLFSQETGSSPLPAQRITSCCLSGGGRLFVLEQIRSDRGLELILQACEAERQITHVCVRRQGLWFRADPCQGCDTLFHDILICFHLRGPPAVTGGPQVGPTSQAARKATTDC